MRLVWNTHPDPSKIGKEVKVGDTTVLKGREDHGTKDETVKVDYFRPPHSTASGGRVTVSFPGQKRRVSMEYYVGIIGAEWIEREDRAAEEEAIARMKGNR